MQGVTRVAQINIHPKQNIFMNKRGVLLTPLFSLERQVSRHVFRAHILI